MNTPGKIAIVFVQGMLASIAFAQDIPPMTATYEVTVNKQLTAGNEIRKVVTGQYYRDSQGRARLEVGNRISISDPVSRVTAFLDPVSMVARRVLLPPVPTSSRIDSASRGGNDQGKEIGERTVDGVNAKGKQYSFTVPENKMGNKRPIVQTIQRWYSDKLKLPILTVSTDEISGERSEGFKSIQVGKEPDPTLFQIPLGYKIEDVQVPVGNAKASSLAP